MATPPEPTSPGELVRLLGRHPQVVGIVEYGTRRHGDAHADGVSGAPQPRISSPSLVRRLSTALVWIWHTRDSVTPSTSPICARVIPSK